MSDPTPMVRLRDFGRSVGNAVLESVGRAASRVQETTPLPADVLESDDAYLVVFDTPGATASDVQVRYSGGTVFVRVDRFREYFENFEMRFPGRGLSLDGEVELPRDALIDPEHATATLRENGTLHVEIPKRQSESADDTASESESEPESDEEHEQEEGQE
ncbi:MAG: Hsp20/alpha crystallin family protein [Halobacteriales archaeon]